MGKFVVAAGVKCSVSRAGSDVWQPFVTRRECVFREYRVAANGGLWEFESGEWLMRVSPVFVVGRNPPKRDHRPKGQSGTFNKCVMGKNGRGAGRRRNMRAARRR